MSPASTIWLRSLSRLGFAFVLFGTLGSSQTRAEDLSGEKIYQNQCVQCHGKKGEGSDECDRALEGDLSVSQLANVIQETMPIDDPETLSDEQAKAVAGFVHETFYSAIARARNRPAKIEVSRLTVKQYRRTLTDLIASFRAAPTWGTERGLQARYYRGRQPRGGGNLAETRIDAKVDFNFGTGAPVEGIKDARRFAIQWEGALLATETGFHDFVVRSDNAIRLWVNDMDQPLIDAWVKSGDETEYKGRLYLVAGTIYPLRLEFTKANQGVDNEKKEQSDEKATITLLWKRPAGVLETIPNRQLSPKRTAEQYICATPFPPDDRSTGWERGTAVSKAWQQATNSAAIDAAGYVAKHINELARTKTRDSGREDKVRTFCEQFGERAFRMPLAENQKKIFVARQFEGNDIETAVKRVVLLTLESPRFLFREVNSGPEAYHVAARLSFGLWDSLPDQTLFRAAAENQLSTKAQIAKQAERMLADPRAQAKLHGFLLTWLKADVQKDVSKDRGAFPDFDDATISDLRQSLELFLDDVITSEQSDFRRLVLEDELFLNDRLASFFGASTDSGERFVKVKLDGGERAGVLTHPYLMARLSHRKQTSPIHRGVLLARGMLGVALRPPPVAIAPTAADLQPGLTTRERVTMQTKQTSCMTCHSIINSLGFTLERYDPVGRLRNEESGKPINDRGSYQTRSGRTITIVGARSLAQMLAENEDAHNAFTEQLFHHLAQQPVRAYGADTLQTLRQSFVANKLNIRKLAIQIMTTAALVGRDS